MDFLDPRKKKAHRRRLVFGYALMSVLIGVGTMTLLYLSYGYDVDRETGQLIQNGIIFADSQPQGASVYLNDKLQPNATDTRLDVPAGTYTLRLERNGYRNWERKFSLTGGEFQRIVYPLLIPNVLETTDVQTFDALPKLTTQSPDRRWLLVQDPSTVYRYTVFDLNNPEDEPSTVQIPLNILTNPSVDSQIEVIEWSTNNRHILLKRTFGDNSEFLMFDREEVGQSVNINTLLGVSPSKVSLKNKRPDQIYYLDAVPGLLRIANTKDRNISAPIAQDVHEYKTYGDDTVLLATTHNSSAGKADIMIIENNNTYKVREFSLSSKYVLDISKYDGEWFYVAGASTDNVAYIYEDPLKSLRSNDSHSLNVATIIRMDNPQFTSFSANTQFVMVQNGKEFVTFDLHDSKQYSTKLEHDIAQTQELKWMDGHRLIYVVNNQSYIIDFDGSNEETLLTSMGILPYWDRDYDNVFTLESSKTDQSKQALTITKIFIEQ